jgi:hypothetical protein
MAAVIIVLLLEVVAGICAAVFLGGAVGVSRAGGTSAAADPDLRYPVPFGVDPATVITTLKREGYEATEGEDAQHQPVVNIRRHGERVDREAVRSALERVPFNEGHEPAGVTVRFTDE